MRKRPHLHYNWYAFFWYALARLAQTIATVIGHGHNLGVMPWE